MEVKAVTLERPQLIQEDYLNQILILLIGAKNDLTFSYASNLILKQKSEIAQQRVLIEQLKKRGKNKNESY